MADLFLALSARVLVDLESMNMAGSVGNVTKHRRAPVVINTESGFKLLQVPVVSGMSLAYSYQYLLAQVAKDNNLPVTDMSLLGYFMKFSDDNIIKNYYKEIGKLPDDVCKAEKTLVEKDVVADIGGFLYTDGGIKRNSRFSFSYMMPAIDALKAGAVGLTPQIHVRFSPKAEKGEQAIIYVENGSALYTLSFILDASGISKLDMCRALGGSDKDLGTDVRKKRFNAAISALIAMLGNGIIGAKRARNLPHYEVQSAVIVVSKNFAPIVPSPAHDPKYLAETSERVNVVKDVIQGLEYEIHYYTKEQIETVSDKKVIKHSNLEEAIKASADFISNRLS